MRAPVNTYKTGQPIRYDARDHLRWLASRPAFHKERPRWELSNGGPLPPLASYGAHHVPRQVANRDRLVDRPLGTMRHKVVGVLPLRMRCLSEMLYLVGLGQLEAFCDRVESTGSRPLLDRRQVERLRGAVSRRLDPGKFGVATEADRKTIARLLRHIDPAVCRPPVDSLDSGIAIGYRSRHSVLRKCASYRGERRWHPQRPRLARSRQPRAARSRAGPAAGPDQLSRPRRRRRLLGANDRPSVA